MAKTPTRPLRAQSSPRRRAKPVAAAADNGRYQRVLARCTPTARQYREYREDVEIYIDVTNGQGRPLSMHGVVGAVRKLELRPSVIFQREYLIAWVDPVWLARVAPSCDAIASSLEPVVGFAPPPMIIAPETRRRSRSAEFTSVIEHEIVHVNQALRGAFRWASTPASIEELLSSFFIHTAMEFEAELLQRTRWPHRLLSRLGLTLPQWCLLRGYTQAVEHVLRDLAHERIAEQLAAPFVAQVQLEARQRLRDLGLGKELLGWFETRWARDVAGALTVLKSEGIDLATATRLRPVIHWLKAHPDFTSSEKSPSPLP